MAERRDPPAFLGSPGLGRLFAGVPMTCLDIGARGGFKDDLLPLAFAVHAVGVEPDAEECARLNAAAARDPGPWASQRYLATALAEHAGMQPLHLTRRRGTSSMLEADEAQAGRFRRGHYYAVDATLELACEPLDAALARYGVPAPAFLKIDIEGMELPVLRGAPATMAGLLGLRVEATFLAVRRGQPLFHEMEAFLRGHGLEPMGLLELHHWRRTTLAKHPRPAADSFPYSRGQIAHGDMLYLRTPEGLADGDAPAAERRLQAAALALCYEQVDHAWALLDAPGVRAYVAERWPELDLRAELMTASRHLAGRWRQAERRRRWLELKLGVRRLLGAAPPG